MKTQKSHLTLGLIGEGKMWSPKTGITDAKTILDEYHLEPIHLDAGEGIAMINGTTYTHTLAIEALNRTRIIELDRRTNVGFGLLISD